MIWIDGIIAIIIYLVVGLFLNVDYKKKSRCYPHQVRLPQKYFFLGIISSIFFAFGSMISFLGDKKFLALICIIFSSFSFGLVIGYFKNRIYFDEEKIISYKLFRVSQKIYYKDIKKFRIGFDIEIETDSNKLLIPNYMVGYEELVICAHKILPQSRHIRGIKKPKVRKFKDSVERPKEFLFGFVIMEILSVALLLILIFVDIQEKDLKLALSMCVGLPIFINIVIVITVVSAKRAHSSKFWRFVAKYCFKPGYLKD